MNKLLMFMFMLTGCGSIVVPLGDAGECVFRYPDGKMFTFDNVESVRAYQFNDEVVVMSLSDGHEAIVDGFGSVQCYAEDHQPVLSF